ncbi:MAG: glycogen/starch/alpha-glucan phosphorylase [Firmicutes bacterium]|nr:glycogen/starch/alpha-glucan phosphorylase [Bacillota bacterium]
MKMTHLIEEKLEKNFSTSPKKATTEQLYKAIALVIRDILLTKKSVFNKKVNDKKIKRVYYLCMEFLLGRSLKNHLYNLGIEEEVKEALKEWKATDLDTLYEIESDAGLGNGGLGRLAACFMDSLATLEYPAMGFSIRYEYGLFKQRIVDNIQVELPDQWLDTGDIWMSPRSDKTFKVKLGGHVREEWQPDGSVKIYHNNPIVINAHAYDFMLSGANSGAVTPLRLWKASAGIDFDMRSFSQGDYIEAMKVATEAEIICKVLYPSDEHDQGKQLRVSQQYFLVSASLQCIIADHLRFNKCVRNLADLCTIHINDTHPALAVPELMRLLIDEHGLNWDEAWDITHKCMAYTNHTVLAEALEKWGYGLIRSHLPRIFSIIKEIDRRFIESERVKGTPQNRIDAMQIIRDEQVKMANLSVIGSHTVNGVSALHSEIIKDSVFNDFYQSFPERFTNVTNGIAYRRWLAQCNPRLTKYIQSLIGDGFLTKASELEKLLPFVNDKKVLKDLAKIKAENKKEYAEYVLKTQDFILNPEHKIDTQIKRLHEYKRQLLNVLKIIHQYLELTQNPNMDIVPTTYVFGAKAAGGYHHAKRVISLINALSKDIQKNKRIKDRLDVYFVENYNVTKAEHLIPASEVSQQISLAGKEASGTGNMKFMINGALTLGTMDGANVEIHENVGDDNIFIFGMTTPEVEKLWERGYYASVYAADPQIKRILDALRVGFDGTSFSDIANYLIMSGGHNHIADPYMVLADFKDYLRVASEIDRDYKNPDHWNKMSLVNIAKAGVFSSDRSIEDYAKNIWNLKKVK